MTKLEKMLKFVSEHNEFYKQIIKEHRITNLTHIAQYPILTRQQIQKNRYNMFSDGYKAKYMRQELRRQSSSGSSGVPVNVYWDLPDYYASMRVLWHKRLAYYGISPSHRYIKFTSNAFNTNAGEMDIHYEKESKNVININFFALRNEQQYKILLDFIDNFSPEWLYIQPIVLQKLMCCYQKNDRYPPASIIYIESVGELLPIDLKKRASSFFKAPVVNLYGSEEMNGIAYECPYHQMHILSDNIFLECLNSQGQYCSEGEGEAIVTNLANKAMPLIRYNQADRIAIKQIHSPCLCGSIDPIISQINGRVFESVYIDDTELNSWKLLSILSNVNNQFDGIMTNYRFVYIKSQRKLMCLIELNDDQTKWFESVQKEIVSAFRRNIEVLCNLTIEVTLDHPLNEKKNKLFQVVEGTIG